MISLVAAHHERQAEIIARLAAFRAVAPTDYFWELVFCLLTPQSKAERCFSAVQELRTLPVLTQARVARVLRKHTRFHNHKASYVLLAQRQWPNLVALLDTTDRLALRNELASRVKGLGLKEAGHFLRNIGKSDHQFAILDRHVLKHMHAHRVISQPFIKSTNDYFALEQKYLTWTQQLAIPADELDLVLWSLETGKVFK